jgi:hypothetical protein
MVSHNHQSYLVECIVVVRRLRTNIIYIIYIVDIETQTAPRSVCRCCRDAFFPKTTAMSRLSMLPRSRESVFASGIDTHRSDANAVCPPNLRECVLAMEDCCEEVGDLWIA